MVHPDENELIEQACRFDQQLRASVDAGPVHQEDSASSATCDPPPDSHISAEQTDFHDDPPELQLAKKALLFLNEVREAAAASETQLTGNTLRASSRTTQLGHSLPTNSLDSNEKSSSSLPRQLGRYEILSPIGQGGFADVYLARDPALDRLVALKIPRPHLMAAAIARRRFEREARAAATLGHPQIVPVYEFGVLSSANAEMPELHELSYIAFEFVPGSTLSQWLTARTTPTPVEEAAAIVQKLAEAIEHAHQRGVVHRDLKPSNILIDHRHSAPFHTAGEPLAATHRQPIAGRQSIADQLRIADFGLAKHDTLDDSLLTVEGMVLGTPAYMSPEQAKGTSDIGPATDIYALGIILYELLTGRLPFKRDGQLATLQAITTEPPRPLRQLRPKLCRSLEAICLKCLEKSIDARYGSAFELAEDLQAWRGGRPIAARPATTTQKLMQWVKRNPILAGALLMTITSLSLGMAVATWKYREAALHLADAKVQRDRAERHLGHLEKMADDILGDLAFELRAAPHMDPIRRDVMRKALALQTALIDEEPDSDLVRARTVKAHLRTTELLRQLGEPESSSRHIQAALALANEVDPQSQLFAETQYLVTELNNHRARLMLDQNNFAAARDILEPSRQLATQQEMGNMSSGRVPMLAELHRLLGMTYEGLGEFTLAEEAYRVGLHSLPQAVTAHPIEGSFMQALLTNSLAVLYNQTGRSKQALETYIEVAKLLDELLAEHPQRVDFNGLAATVAFNLGNRYSNARSWTEAERHYRKSQQSFANLHAASPLDSLVLRSTAEVTGMLASSLTHLERLDEARAHFEQALELIAKSSEPQLMRDVRIRHTNNFARMLADDLNQPDQARILFSQVIEEHESLVDAVDKEQLARSLAFACKSLGEIERRMQPDNSLVAKTWHEKQLKFAFIVLNKNPADQASQRDVALAFGSLAQCALNAQEFTAAWEYAEQIAGIDAQLPDMAYRAGREHAKLYLRMRQEGSLGATESQLQQTLERVTAQLRNARTLQHERLDELLSKDPIWRELPESVVLAASN